MTKVSAALIVAFVCSLAGWLLLQSGMATSAGHADMSHHEATGHEASQSGTEIGAAVQIGAAGATIVFVCCSYTPNTVTITAGESVTWQGNFAFPHPLREVDGPTSDTPVPGAFANSTGTSYEVQFNVPGTYYFQCVFHGLAQFGGTMRGKIIVLPAGGANLDIDGSNTATKYDALTDGLLAIRYMFGLTGPSLTAGALGGTASRNTPDLVKAYLDANRLAFDIDGDGNVDALTDGLLILRYLFNLRGPSLVQGAVVPGHRDAAAIETYLGTLTP